MQQGIIGYRANMDQENAIRRTHKELSEKISKKRQKPKGVLNVVNLVLVIGIIGFIINSINGGDFSSTIIMRKLFFGACVSVGIIGLAVDFNLARKVNKSVVSSEKSIKNLWGAEKSPDIFYRYDEYLDEFDIHLSFSDSSDMVHIGRISADDELAEGFEKTRQEDQL